MHTFLNLDIQRQALVLFGFIPRYIVEYKSRKYCFKKPSFTEVHKAKQEVGVPLSPDSASRQPHP
jgi:hypothetical protein